MSIDVHAHYVPPRVLRLLEESPTTYGAHLEEAAAGSRCVCFDYGVHIRPFFPELLDLDQRWKEMERTGVERQVLSTWLDLSGYGLSSEQGGRWHRMLNESLSEVAQKHSDRLSMLATAPLQDAHRAALELEYGVKQCGAVGGVIAANVEGTNLGDVDLDEFWAAAVELDMALFLHPTQPTLAPRTAKYGLSQIVQYTYDSTVTIGSLVFSGVLDRFPGLKFLLPHAGGYFPYQVGRFDRMYRVMEPTTPDHAPSAYLRRFYYDTITHHPVALKFLRELVGADRILLGTDYPFPPADPVAREHIKNSGCTEDEVAQIASENARQLFKL